MSLIGNPLWENFLVTNNTGVSVMNGRLRLMKRNSHIHQVLMLRLKMLCSIVTQEVGDVIQNKVIVISQCSLGFSS